MTQEVQYPKARPNDLEEEVVEGEPQEGQIPFNQPALELVVHAAMMQGSRIPLQDGQTMQLVHFHTPAISLTLKLDENGKAALLKILTGGVEIVRPQPAGIIVPGQ